MKPTMIMSYKFLWEETEHFLNQFRVFLRKLNFTNLTKPVAFLPGGTGNSFLRDFDIKDYQTARDMFFLAFEKESTVNIDSAIITYNKVKSDLSAGDVSKRIMFNIWGVGLISDITKLAIRMRKIGSMNYTVASLIKLFSHKPYKLKAIIDGVEELLNCNMVTVSNSRFTGGKMQIAPHIRVNDGKLFLISPMLKLDWLYSLTFLKFSKGIMSIIHILKQVSSRKLKFIMIIRSL
jgi:diacylglycerol kinase family enzyme